MARFEFSKFVWRCRAEPEEPRLDHPLINTFMRFATICRVTKIIRSYLEALL
ncbi:MAG: hypothetical protein WCR46_26385 [Deltaproteobacteria bacterium]